MTAWGGPEGQGLFAPHVLREYALLADGQRGALVGPRGELAWMCFPRWDSDALFSSLIGGGGTYAVTPESRHVGSGYYEQGTLVWRSRWVTEDDAIVECREALALPASAGCALVLRRVVARAGPVRARVVLDLRGRFGEDPVQDLRRREDGAWTGRVGDLRVVWSGGEAAEVDEDREGGTALVVRLELQAGDEHDLVLAIGAEEQPDLLEAEHAWQDTEAEWRRRVPALERTIGRRDARHSYAILCGLTSEGGGTVAAATTSLPERAREGRNFDYRYVWVRDQCYIGQAAASAGPLPLLDDAVRFVRERVLADGPKLRPAYTVTGGEIPDQRDLDLPGYPGGTDVVGNHVKDQFQLDAFGEALLLFAAAARHDRLDADGWRAVELVADAIARRWREPDAGIWELDPREWTHSRLICAAGLRGLGERGPGGQAARWTALADEITADCSRRALHRSGRWQRAPDDERLDASLLLLPIRGAIAPDDPRSIATLEAIDSELAEDGYMYRYRPDERPLGEAEGAFLLCGFLASLARARAGERETAVRWFERSRAASGPPGLLSEEFDVSQRQLRGNLPQAFVHALLLECAAELYREGPARRGVASGS